MLNSINDPKIDWLGKRVLLRLDLNVPLNAEGEIIDDTRIKASLETTQFLLTKGARLIIASHLGRPKGKVKPELSLEPVARRLQELLDREIIFVHDCIGDGIKRLITELKPGNLLLLENLRFHSSEEKNEGNFAKLLAQNIDVYVNDAFGAAHRPHASVEGITRYVPIKLAGFLMQKEVENLNNLIQNPKRPFVAIIGGSKVSDKIAAIAPLLGRIDTLVIGGAMAYTFLKAQGKEIGNSRFEENRLQVAAALLKKASDNQVEVILPKDHVVVSEFSKDAPTRIVKKLEEGDVGIDIGPETLSACERAIHFAKTIFWNGPVGVYEWESGVQNTLGIAKAVAESEAFSVVGGGDSIAALHQADVYDKISYVSTGGGACLEFLQGIELPGVKPLIKR
ncbi:MAG: phosphoglycerate kinase [Deltaproteobacteria bacterium]|nr:phosphoglycerate kinase [Deltaproteobacteria bacterium]